MSRPLSPASPFTTLNHFPLSQLSLSPSLSPLSLSLYAHLNKQGPTHPETLTAVGDLAACYAEMERYPEAGHMYLECVYEQVKPSPTAPPPGPLFPSCAPLPLARSLTCASQCPSQHAQWAQEEQLGLMHPETLRSMHGLAVVYFKLGKYDLAENLLIPCLSGRRQKLGVEVRVGHVPCVAFSSSLIVIVHPSSPPLLMSPLPRVRAPFCGRPGRRWKRWRR
jgi:hypothetical protein